MTVTVDNARQGRRWREVADALTARIAAGEFDPGTRLPPERELAQTLGVGRATVREAMLALELSGLVEIRVGAGVFVVATPAPAPAPVPDEVGPFAVLEARRLVEGEVAFRAAQRADAPALKALRAATEDMEAALDDVPRYDAADRRFHFLLAAATENPLMEGWVRQAWDMRTGALWDRWYARTRSRENRIRSAADHRLILKAVARRLPEQAATAMRAHIDVLAGRFLDLKLEEDPE